MKTPSPPTRPPQSPSEDFTQSVAGEEDPGAAMDMPWDKPAPGDETPPGTPGTGDDVSPRRGGGGGV